MNITAFFSSFFEAGTLSILPLFSLFTASVLCEGVGTILYKDREKAGFAFLTAGTVWCGFFLLAAVCLRTEEPSVITRSSCILSLALALISLSFSYFTGKRRRDKWIAAYMLSAAAFMELIPFYYNLPKLYAPPY